MLVRTTAPPTPYFGLMMPAPSGGSGIHPDRLIEVYDKREQELERTPPHWSFREAAGTGLAMSSNNSVFQIKDMLRVSP